MEQEKTLFPQPPAPAKAGGARRVAAFAAVGVICAGGAVRLALLARQAGLLPLVLLAVVFPAALCAALGLAVTAAAVRRAQARARQPLQALSQALERLAGGDTAAALPVGAPGAAALGMLAGRMEGLENALQAMARAARQGTFTAPADTAAPGVFGRAAQAMQTIAQAAKEGARETAASLRQLAAGGLPERTQRPGVFGEADAALAEAAAMLGTLAADARRLERAAQAGEIESLPPASAGLAGAWGEAAGALRGALAAVAAPVALAADRMEWITEGRQEDYRTNEYQGLPGRLLANISGLFSALMVMEGECLRVRQACEGGDFTARGDLAAVRGGQRTIVDSVNRALDAAFTPVISINQALARMCVCDFSQEIEGEYTGVPAEMAGHVKELRKMLLNLEHIFERVAAGDTGQLETLEKLGRFSEQDRLTPASAASLRSIRGLLAHARSVAEAAEAGALETRVAADDLSGEFAAIIREMNSAIASFETPISELIENLRRMAQGDLDIPGCSTCSGAYARLMDGVSATADAVSGLIQNIRDAAEQVLAGAHQISGASQALSQTAAEQAASVEEVTASVEQLDGSARKSAEQAAQAARLAEEIRGAADKGSQNMGHLQSAMHEIETSSKNIARINRTIDDIAFQTNILALNAAVEAARAGQYGKGFAVVAEEVRNLAARSATAAKEAAALVEQDAQKVAAGLEAADGAVTHFASIARRTGEAAGLMHTVSGAVGEQSHALDQVAAAIRQISITVQSNSATSEEAAASSEELASQAEMLRGAVAHFTLRREDAGEHCPVPRR